MRKLGLIILLVFSFLTVKAQLELSIVPAQVGSDLELTISLTNNGLPVNLGSFDIPFSIDTVGLDIAGMTWVEGPRFGSNSAGNFYLPQQATLVNANTINYAIRPDYVNFSPMLPLGDIISTGETVVVGTIYIPIEECKSDIMLAWLAAGDPQAGARLDWLGNDLDPVARNVPVSPFSVSVSSLVVDNLNDSGCGSLRHAIETANNNPGPDVIDLSALTFGDVINLGSPLTITDDFTTFDFGINTPCAGNIVLVGDGTFDAFVLDNVEGVAIEKFNIQNFERGIFINGGRSNIVQCNFIGTDLAGTGAAGTGNTIGVDIFDSRLNLIGDSTAGSTRLNLISGNAGEGIRITGISSANVISANLIGTDLSGTTSLANGGNGIFLSGDDVSATLIGSRNGSGNLISGNNENGVEIIGGGLNFIFRNFIGTNITGLGAIPNDMNGVRIDNSTLNIVGDSLNNRGNVISGNARAGVYVSNSDTNRISSNVIGLDTNGVNPIPNNIGVLIDGGSTRTVVGSLRGAGGGNFISGNAAEGVQIDGTTTASNYVFRNLIGVDINGDRAPNGGSNVLLSGGTHDNAVGLNIIAYAPIGSYGIEVTGTSEDNIWGANAIYSNGQKGIHFANNTLQEALLPPTITFSGTTYSGIAQPGAQIQIFADTNNQGAFLLDTAIANAGGVWTKTFTTTELQTQVDAGRNFITAIQTYTRTPIDINSSEFSVAAPICIPPVADIQNPLGGAWEFCRGDTLSITSDFVSGATYSFYMESTSNAVNNVTDSTANLVQADFLPSVVAISDNLIVEVEISPAGCLNRDTVEVILNPAPTVDILLSNPQNLCENSTLTLSVLSSTGSGDWATLGDGTFDDSSIPNAEYSPGVNDILNGSLKLYFTSSNNGACSPRADTLDVNITPAPTLDVGPDQAICQGDVLSLNATTSDPNVFWSSPNGSGNFNPLTPSMSVVYTPTAGDISGGVPIIIRGTIAGGVLCSNVTDEMELTFTTATQVDAGPDTIACPPVNIDLKATPLNNYHYSWTRAEGGVATGPTPNDSIFTATLPGKYYVDVISPSGSCPSRDSVVVTQAPSLSTPNVIFFSANSTSVTFAWDTVPNAASYTLYIDTCRMPDRNCTALAPVTVANMSPFRYTQTGLSVGDSVLFQVESNDPCGPGGNTTSAQVYGLADSCNANFSGLNSSYCTASNLARLYPDFNGGVFTASPVPSAVKYSGSFYYFDPSEAGPGNHWIFYENCNGVKDSAMTVVAGAPCVTTVVDDSTSAFVKEPFGIATDCDGQIFTSSNSLNAIVKIDTFGVASIISGDTSNAGFLDGPLGTTLVQRPYGLIVHPSGEIYFIDGQNHALRKVTTTNTTVTLVGGGPAAGTGISGQAGDSDIPGNAALNRMFNQPFGLAFNATYDTVFIGDAGNGKIKAVDIATLSVTTIAGNNSGAVPAVAGPQPGTNARFVGLGHLSADASNLYISDINANAVYIYNFADKTVYPYVGDGGAGKVLGDTAIAQLNQPNGVAVDPSGNLFIADKGNNSIKLANRYATPNTVTVQNMIGSNDNFQGNVCVDGDATTTRMTGPTAVSVFVKGFIDIADAGCDKIRRYAIEDYLNSPLRELDTTYCFGDDPDTLASSLFAGAYSGTGVTNSGGYWIFNPTTVGTYDVCYDYQAGYCSESLCLTVTVAPSPPVDLGMDTTIICSNQYGVDSLKVDSNLVTRNWRVNGVATPGNNWFRIIDQAPARYTVAVRDTNGCTARDTIYIILSQSIVDAGTPPANLCAFTPDTISDATINGSLITPPGYTVAWSPALGLNRTDTLHPVVTYKDTTVINYLLSVTDTAGCVDTSSISFTIEPLPNVFAAADPVSDTLFCIGSTVQLRDTTSINVGSYSWLPTTGLSGWGTKTPTASPTTPTTYTVTFTDGNGCIDSSSVTLRPVDLGGQITLSQDTACLGDVVTASITITGSPEGRLSYNWESQGATDQSTFTFPLSLQRDSVLTLFVYDSTSMCSYIPRPDTLFANKLSVSFVDDSIFICNPDSAFFDGTITGGIAPYIINWTGSAGDVIVNGNTEDPIIQPTNIGVSKFYIDITESGTASCSITDSVVVNRASLTTVDARANPVADTVFCLNSTVKIIAVPNKVTTNPSPYLWTPTTGLNNNTWQSPDATPLDTTVYTVVFTDDQGCTATDSVTLYPVSIGATVSFDLDTACVGDNVTATATVTGSPANRLSYNWNGTGAGASNTFNFNVTLKKDTTISVEIYDTTARCAPQIFTATLQVDDLTLQGDSVYLCNLDSVTLMPVISGGKTPYTYLWTSGNPGDYIDFNNIQNPKVYPQNVGANYFYLEVTDAPLTSGTGGNCTVRDSFNVFKAPPITIQAAAVPAEDTIVCAGMDVDLTARAVPASAGGSYSWSPATGLNNAGIQNPTAIPADTITYYARYTDANGCESTLDSVTIYPQVLDAALTFSKDTACVGQAITVTGSPVGGIGPFSYSYDDVTYSASPTTVVNPLVNTTITVYVYDSASKCKGQHTEVLEVNDLSLSFVNNTLNVCFGDTATIEAIVTGGKPAYTPLWTGPGYIESANTLVTKVVPAVTGNSTYTMTVEDQPLNSGPATGCTVTGDVTVFMNTEVVADAGIDTTICAGSPVNRTATATGGVSPYSFLWSEGTSVATLNDSPSVDTEYIVTVTDQNNCADSDTMQVTVLDFDVELITEYNNFCPGNKDSVYVNFLTPGSGRYSYSFDGGSTFIANPYIIIYPMTSRTVNVIVKDSAAANCNRTASVDVTVQEFSIELGPDGNLCSDLTDPINGGSGYQLSGTVRTGGSDPVTVQWGVVAGSPGLPSDVLTVGDPYNPLITPTVPVGTSTNLTFRYYVHVTDNAGCEDYDTVAVFRPLTLFTVAAPTAGPYNICDGEQFQFGITGLPTEGGVPPYNVLWTSTPNTNVNGSTQDAPTFQSNGPGTFTFTKSVTDAIGCDAFYLGNVRTVTVNVRQSPDITFNVTVPSGTLPVVDDTARYCLGDNYTITNVATNPGSTNYQWRVGSMASVPSAGTSISGNTQVKYYHTVSDAGLGCTRTDSVYLKQRPVATVSIDPVAGTTCDNAVVNVTTTYSPTGGTFSWSVNGNPISQTGDQITYTVTASDPNPVTFDVTYNAGCNDAVAPTVSATTTPAPTAVIDLSAATLLPNDTITVMDNSIYPNSSWASSEWTFQGGKPKTASATGPMEAFNVSFANSGSQFICLTVEEGTGCKDSTCVTVNVLSSEIFYIPNVLSPYATDPENKVAKVYGPTIVSDDFRFEVYNRWGELIFESDSFTEMNTFGWNGINQNTGVIEINGVYTYTVNLTFDNGVTIEETGTITIVK